MHVDDALIYQGSASNRDLIAYEAMPVAVSMDAAESFVFTQAPAGVIERAVVCTFIDAKKRDTLPAEDLAWMPEPIEFGRQRIAGQDFRYVVGALGEPFEYFVADLLESKDLSWSGCYLTLAMFRDSTPQSRAFIFYLERLEPPCPPWKQPFAALSDDLQDRFSTFFINLLQFVQFQP